MLTVAVDLDNVIKLHGMYTNVRFIMTHLYEIDFILSVALSNLSNSVLKGSLRQ